ncbi:MAG: preprotein translocase subunit SecG [Bdellovibrionota bacterium]
MFTLLIIFHILLCLALIFLVLLQQGKGADLGAVFGNSNSIFGTSSGDNIGKITTTLAIVFMLSSILLVRGFIAQAQDPNFIKVDSAKVKDINKNVMEGSVLNKIKIDDNAVNEALTNNSLTNEAPKEDTTK